MTPSKSPRGETFGFLFSISIFNFSLGICEAVTLACLSEQELLIFNFYLLTFNFQLPFPSLWERAGVRSKSPN